jgi:hypothetical protein
VEKKGEFESRPTSSAWIIKSPECPIFEPKSTLVGVLTTMNIERGRRKGEQPMGSSWQNFLMVTAKLSPASFSGKTLPQY